MDDETIVDFLDRFDVDISDTDTIDDLLDKVRANWQHKYEMTANQETALREDWEKARQFQDGIKHDERFYFKSSAGNYFPKLASKGIRRFTINIAGVNRTRYAIPGRGGSYGLTRARQIFEEL